MSIQLLQVGITGPFMSRKFDATPSNSNSLGEPEVILWKF